VSAVFRVHEREVLSPVVPVVCRRACARVSHAHEHASDVRMATRVVLAALSVMWCADLRHDAD
jgi:hypothetical protein